MIRGAVSRSKRRKKKKEMNGEERRENLWELVDKHSH
jgi:hypothetical protein